MITNKIILPSAPGSSSVCGVGAGVATGGSKSGGSKGGSSGGGFGGGLFGQNQENAGVKFECLRCGKVYSGRECPICHSRQTRPKF